MWNKELNWIEKKNKNENETKRNKQKENWHASFSFQYVHYSWKELKNQGLPARARWKNRENVLASANEIQANLLLITERFHIQEMLDCIVFSSFRVIR